MKNILLKYTWLLALLCFSLSGCWKEPVYPKEPEIEFNSISQKQSFDALGNPVIEITIALDFKDGDGNMGLDAEETQPPYNDVPGNKFKNNYFINAFLSRKNETEFGPYNPPISYNGRFLRLDDNNLGRALEGQLRYTFNIFPGIDLDKGDKLKFQIQVADRALNLSNIVETAPITLEF
jgi:hypothetical protein